MSSFPTYIKDPDAVLDYVIDWSDWLNSGDTVTAVVYTLEAGLTLDSSLFTTTQTKAVVSGGTLGVEYSNTAHITTNDGLEQDQTFIIKMRQR